MALIVGWCSGVVSDLLSPVCSIDIELVIVNAYSFVGVLRGDGYLEV